MFTKLKYKFRYSILFFLLIATLFIYIPYTFAQGTSFEKIYPTNGVSYGWDVIEKPEGGYLIVGSITPFSTSVLVMNIDINGNLVWEKHLLAGLIRSVTKSHDNNCVLSGPANAEDILILKITRDGDILWYKYIHEPYKVYATKIMNTSDGGYAIIGYIQKNVRDIHLIKTNKNGDTLWTKSYGDSNFDSGYDIREMPDRGFIIAATSVQFIGNEEASTAQVIRTDSTGDLLWSKRFYVNGYADCGGVVVSIDGCIVIGGSTNNTDTGFLELYLLKLNLSGDSLSVFTYGEIDVRGITSIQTTIDGQYIMTDGNGVLKIDNDWNINWSRQLIGTGLSVKQSSDEGFIISGVASGNYDIMLVKTTKDGIVSVEENVLMPLEFKVFQNYPNPFNPSTIIRYEIPGQAWNDNMIVVLKVYDVLGNEITTLVNEEKPAGSYEVDFDGSELSSGIYFYRLHAGDFVETRKMVLLR